MYYINNKSPFSGALPFSSMDAKVSKPLKINKMKKACN